MFTLTDNEEITNKLNAWYKAMIAQQKSTAAQLKEEIDGGMEIAIEDPELKLLYSLLDFRYKLLTDDLSITKNSFEKVEAFDTPVDGELSYYYHFFKAIHNTLLANYNEAKKYYRLAESLLKYAKDDIERAEFYYRIALFYHHTYQPLSTVQYASKAQELFSLYVGHKNNVALCANVLGMCCIQLGQFEKAEEYLTSAVDILQKRDEETLILRVRNNLGWLYSCQNLSSLAVRHLSEVTAKIPNHYKALFLEARERYKLGEIDTALSLIDQGFKVCSSIENTEYRYHLLILEELCMSSDAEKLEGIINEGISYFDSEGLHEYVQEYGELLAVEFNKIGNKEKSQEYFLKAYESKQRLLNKGALK